MKITTKLFYDRFLSGMQSNMEAILNDNEQISSGKRVNRPSDDPTAMSRIVNYKTSLSAITNYKKAIDSSRGFLDATESALNNFSTAITRANELAVGGADGTMDSQSRTMSAKEIGVILDSVMGIANTKVGDRYIFSGYQSNVPPINTKTGEFVSDPSKLSIAIGDRLEIGTNIPGSDLFSFKRTNPTDPDGVVLPSYNWDVSGANVSTDSIYEDADPNSALYTSKPTDFYLNGTNNTVRIDGADYNVFIVNDSNNRIRVDGTDYTIANGNYTNTSLVAALNGLGAGITAAYNAGTKQFTLTTAGATTVNFGNANSTIAKLLGFSPTDKNIGAGITSDTTTSNGVVSGTAIAAALTSLGAGALISAAYDTTTQKFTVTSTGATALNFSSASTTMEKLIGFNSMDRTIGTGVTSDFESVHITDPSNAFTQNGGTLTFGIGDEINKPTPVSVTIAAGSSLNQVRDAINAGKAGVKAEVVNIGTATTPDYRIVIASDPVGLSDKIQITASTYDAAGTGLNTLVYSTTVDTIKVDSTNNQIVINENGTTAVASIAPGTYTADKLATAVKTALEAATASTNTYNVVYDSSGNKFTITSNAGNTGSLDILWSNAGSSAANIMGFSANDTTINPPGSVASNIAMAGPFNISLGINDSLAIKEGTNAKIINIPPGSYTGSQMATVLKTALENGTASGNTYDVTYDSAAQLFRITGTPGNSDQLDLLWTEPGTTAGATLGFNVNSSVLSGTTAGDKALTYGFQSNNFGTDITNYNYITDTSNPNYYSFNNNYLNGKYALRALNFLKASLENNDQGRIEKAIDYLEKVSGTVSQSTAEIGARINKLDSQQKYQEDREVNITTYLSNDQDTDLAKVVTEMTQRQNALQGLRMTATQFLQSNLFDFLK